MYAYYSGHIPFQGGKNSVNQSQIYPQTSKSQTLDYGKKNFNNNSISMPPQNASFMYKNQSQQFNNSSVLQEQHSLTLQKEVDAYTRKVEHEKRKLYATNEAYDMTQKEYKQKQKELVKVKEQQNGTESKKLKTKVKNMQNKTEKMKTQYDSAQSKNKQIQQQIDTQRKERIKFINIHQNLKEQIVKVEEEYQQTNNQIEQLISKEAELKEEIVKMALDNEDQKSVYFQKFDDISEFFNEETRKFKLESSKIINKNESFEENQYTEDILKRRLKKLINANKEKDKVIQQYIKNLKIIDDAFNTIKQGSGIADIDEITNTFIKSEEQNYSLYTYVDILTQEIENLSENNNLLQRQIKEQEEQNEVRKKILEGTPVDEQMRKNYQEKIEQKQASMEQFRSVIQKMKPDLEKLLIDLSKLGLTQNSESKYFEYQLGFDLNENNLEQYLADLENYIIIFLDYQNSKEKSQKKINQTLLLDQLPLKDENKQRKNLNIQIDDLSNNKDFINMLQQIKNNQGNYELINVPSANEKFDHKKLEVQAEEYLQKNSKPLNQNQSK